ncbi:MAG: hypothetical protein HPY65_10450 [Syntrophaceae bacterium]|nr:hypothetical protein [Syntrophaceae bacterium]
MHRSIIRERLTRILIASITVLLIAGCTPSRTSVPDSGAGITVGRIAVLPFQQVSPSEVSVRVAREPVILGDFQADHPDGSPERITERIFLERQKALGRTQIVYPARAGAAYLNAASGSFKIKTADALKKMGSDLGADGIVAGYVYRWRERKGLSYSVEKPASVAFDIHLYRASDGALLWRGLFDQAQESLMENMLQLPFFFKEKGRWLTAEELAAAGMEEVCKTFPAAP